MCGRFSLAADAPTLAAQFTLFGTLAWTPRYNIAPAQEVLAVVQDPASASRQARRHCWGLIPLALDGGRPPARGYFAGSCGTITDKMVKERIADQEGEPLHDASRFRLDDRLNLPLSWPHLFRPLDSVGK